MEITARLMAAASFVREGTFLCDVGTDHAYLPIYLAENGRIRACLASDIHEGPCESARAHIAENGFSEIIEVKRADGLAGFCPRGKTDIVIAGMGGALICEILEKAEGIKTDDVRLILQPMRNVPDLRAYLYANGFDIKDEKLFRNCIKAAFEMRRKTLENALTAKLGGFTKEQVADAISRCGFDAKIRGERLSTEDFVKLSNVLFDIKTEQT
jgi:tRNA A22 N-methylase